MKINIKIACSLVLINFAGYSLLHPQEVTKFTTANGLVDNTVFSVLEDDAQFIWVGTSGGLGRYDGIGWESFTEEKSQLVNNKVNSILKDNEGHLWFGTDKGLSVFYEDRWESFVPSQMPAYLRADMITVLFLDSQNGIWIGTKGGGVTRCGRDKQGRLEWIPYDTGNSGIISDEISAINEDRDGNVWFGSFYSGVCKFDRKSTWTSYSTLSGVIGNKINILFRDQAGSLWIGSNNGVFKTEDGSNWFTIATIPHVQAIAEDLEGNLWLGTQNDGLYKYDLVSCYKPSINGLENIPGIWSIIRDHDGHLWLGTDGAGVFRMQLNWQVFNTANSNLVDQIITGIDEDAAGNLWIATAASGIARFDGIEFDTIWVDGKTLGTNSVHSILVDMDNWIWCATDYGAHGFDGVSRNWISYVDSLPSRIVYSILEDRNGIFWLGTRGGVSRFDGLRWTTFDTSDNLPGQIINAIWQDHQGHLWFGTSSGGVCEMVDNAVTAIYDKSNGLSNNHVTAIIEDNEHVLWVGTLEGLCRFDGARWDTFTAANSGLVNNSINCLFRDDKANIWIGTQGGGLNMFNGRFWVDFSSKFISHSVNCIFQDSDGNYWFGTDAGLVKYIPDKAVPKITITIAPDSIIGVGSALFYFVGYDIETPKEKLLYSYSLNDARFNAVNNWSDYENRNYTEIQFPANGSYIFSVKCKDESGNESQPASVTFIVDTTPPKAFIIHPANDEIITGKVAVIGSAFDSLSLINDFKHYWLSYAAGSYLEDIQETDWHDISDASAVEDTGAIAAARDSVYVTIPVINDTLITWNTNGLYGDHFLRLAAQDTLGHVSYYIVKVKIVIAHKELLRERGGSLDVADRVCLYLPPGAIEEDEKIYCNPVQVIADSGSLDSHMKFSKLAYLIGPEGLSLKKPATLTLFYGPNDIAGLDEKKLSLMRVDSNLAEIDRERLILRNIHAIDEAAVLGGWVDLEDHSIRSTIRRLGSYLLAEDNRSIAGQSQITELDCQPRIFSPRGTGFSLVTTISFKLTAESPVSIKIYNLAGRLVHVLVEHEKLRAGYSAIEWDGRDFNGHICPSDLYLVVIETEKEVKTKTVMVLDKS